MGAGDVRAVCTAASLSEWVGCLCCAVTCAMLQDKRVAGEQEKSVNAEATKIGKEAEEANVIASQVRMMR